MWPLKQKENIKPAVPQPGQPPPLPRPRASQSQTWCWNNCLNRTPFPKLSCGPEKIVIRFGILLDGHHHRPPPPTIFATIVIFHLKTSSRSVLSSDPCPTDTPSVSVSSSLFTSSSSTWKFKSNLAEKIFSQQRSFSFCCLICHLKTPPIFAGSLICTQPLLIIYIYFCNYFIFAPHSLKKQRQSSPGRTLSQILSRQRSQNQFLAVATLTC